MKNRLIWLASLAVLAVAARCAPAQDLEVYADRSFAPALKEISALFVQQTGFDAHFKWGRSAALAEKIVHGAQADVFFPATENDMQQVVEKGLVDVSLKRNVLVVPPAEPPEAGIVPETQYTSAAVLLDAANRLPAMAFLEFLVSEPARAAFARQGFALP